MNANNIRDFNVVSADVIIVGSGLVGVLIAINIALEGRRVLVCDRSELFSQASALNAGGVRRIGRSKEEMPLAMAAHDLWRKTSGTPLAGAFNAVGHLILAETDDEAETLHVHLKNARDAGMGRVELMSAAQISNRVPGLHTNGLTLGLFTPDDGYAEPDGVGQSVIQAAIETGVGFSAQTNVTGLASINGGFELETDRGKLRCAKIVNAAGYGGSAIAGLAGDDFRVETRAPIALETAAADVALGPVVQTVGRRLTLKQVRDGRFLIGGGHRGVPYPDEGRAESISDEEEQNLATARSLLGALDGVEVTKSWAGLEAYSTDGLPIIGRSAKHPDIIHAFAFSGHGFQIAPAVAQVVADLVAEREPRTDISGLAAERFSTQDAAADIMLEEGDQ
ncbi:NAD(P)/FAD-dependent oxidoreductase [Hoeflea prorocentri]|uniref:FAD-binding oxidoreductase n=1 Tax=Hoeflea prorocentri TaxID=1922333 RepID=A0A9X3ZG08_9HYPH|nr:FAD-binding oxidoreductase [Hoeflea prorocentri]MCY6379694.1 FAD-binding oxidoreductase [Hoeflea prorocentri]MDA5397494.1 FAD-binding oxidoreductase [Hoeflea prorocentri]